MGEFADNDFQLYSSSDLTKQLFFNVGALPVNSDLTCYFPDFSALGGSHNGVILLSDRATGIMQFSFIADLENGFTFHDSANASDVEILPSNISGNASIFLPNLPTVSIVGADTGTGKVSLTGQTANIGTTALLTAPTTGTVYRVTAYIEGTTVGTGTLTVTIGWTDNVGATTDAGLTLSLLGTGRASRTIPVFVASGNVTYAVSGYLTGAYALYIRTEIIG
jgi:hypothetical protein